MLGDEIQVFARSQDGGSAQAITTDSVNLAPGAWRYVTAVVDYAADSILIYVDGVLQSTTGSIDFLNAAVPNTPSSSAALGAEDDGGSEFFDGSLDEVRVQTGARSADWIRAQYLSMTNASFVTFGGAETAPGASEAGCRRPQPLSGWRGWRPGRPARAPVRRRPAGGCGDRR